eukprot:CAMPEP_0198662802 /NCGR_PEP_ID=MMETSP1467-20131203/49234_1 /TAXON_ID=1462469 /ORGANISM="unid. sp., Strain CCMP2135" /LENGTH=501 /DNA_ID=CAMNT_0044399305 /DNA_START=45 /DNA_END=1550 /DNA_ORIENTATION=+
MASTRVTNLLDILGEDLDFAGAKDVDEEFQTVKKAYFKAILKAHPDKGGDPATFRDIQAAFMVLKTMYEKKRVTTFVGKPKEFATTTTKTAFESAKVDLSDLPTPSWEFYAEAAAETVPKYRVELAKSDRSKCAAKGAAKKCSDETIARNELRFGSLLPETGTYTRWCHLQCWRIPARVWQTFPEEGSEKKHFAAALSSLGELLFSGFDELPENEKDRVVAYAMDKDNYAKARKPAAPKHVEADEAAAPEAASSSSNAPLSRSSALVNVQQREAWSDPVAGVDGATANALHGHVIVCTGTFPELGGGMGLTLGADRAKALLQRFGARVTGSISGKTTALLVGKEPGFRKVSDARDRNLTMLGLRDLKSVIQHQLRLEDVEPMVVTSFSAGYVGNSAANNASAIEMQRAMGLAPAQIEPAQPKAPPPKRKATEEDDDDDEEEEEAPEPPPKKKPAPKKKAPPKKKAKAAPPADETAVVPARTSRTGRTSRMPSRFTPSKSDS